MSFNRYRRYSVSGFTLVEIIIVVVILGIFAGFGLISLKTAIERNISMEGVNILTSLLGAHQRYQLENSAYTNNLNNLDITIPTSQNFNAPTIATTDPMATIQRNDSSYTLFISSTGAITCSPASGICKKLKY